MRIEYDPTYNIAYIRLLESEGGELQTLHVSEELNIDMTPDGRIYGIELLNANEQLLHQDSGQLVIENRQSGRREAVPLA
jgi:uncharacterized protein YuzE